MRWPVFTVLAGFVCSLSMSTLLHGGELIMADANETEGHYTLALDMRIRGSHRDVYAVLMDFNNLPAVNDTVISSELLESKGNQHRVKYISEGCVLFFCQTVAQVAMVTEMDGGYIMTKVDPALSDLKYGSTLWQVIDEGETTRIKYNADYVPDFWVPPIIGDYIFKERMIEEGIKTVNGIEKLITIGFPED